MKEHIEIKPFWCPICGLVFNAETDSQHRQPEKCPRCKNKNIVETPGSYVNSLAHINMSGGWVLNNPPQDEKENKTMKVSYKGFTGELVKLERKIRSGIYDSASSCASSSAPVIYYCYDISIYDAEKKVTHSFEKVNKEDITFLNGKVSFG